MSCRYAGRSSIFLSFRGVPGPRRPRRAALPGAAGRMVRHTERRLRPACHILRDGTLYQKFGGAYFDPLNPERTAQRLLRRLAGIGFVATLSRQAGDSTPGKRPSRRRPQPPPAAPSRTCRQCAGWGIACIHARGDKFKTEPQADTDKLTTYRRRFRMNGAETDAEFRGEGLENRDGWVGFRPGASPGGRRSERRLSGVQDSGALWMSQCPICSRFTS